MIKNISEIVINAPATDVWDAITNPEMVKKRQYGSDLTSSWEPGTSIKFSTVWEGNIFEQWGTVLEFEVNRILKYNLFAPRPGLSDLPENYFIMNYILEEEWGQTKLIIEHIDDRPIAKQNAPQGEENPILQNLKFIIENK